MFSKDRWTVTPHGLSSPPPFPSFLLFPSSLPLLGQGGFKGVRLPSLLRELHDRSEDSFFTQADMG